MPPRSDSALPAPDFSRFYRHDELSQLLRDFAAARPDLVGLGSIGRSHEGREIWVVTLTRRATGAPADKPAFWTDGNIHAAELTASTAVLYYLHHLLQHDGADSEEGRRVTRLLDTRTLYLCPRLNPDGAELALADRPRHIRSSTRRYPHDEEPVDGLTVEDVDGDGRILLMRIADPHGSHKKCERDPRLMVPREPGEFGGEYYRMMPEGTIRNHDGVTVRVNADPEGLDLNRNFPAGWRHEAEQPGAGPYPTSEPEVRAMVDFILAHPNIGAAISYHTHSGVILRPMGSCADDDMIPEDLWTYQRFSEIGTRATGYPAVSIWHEFKYHPKEVITGTQDWVYEHLGALFWVVELWAPNRQAGISDYPWIHWYRDHPVEDDLKLLKWSDEACGGAAHVDWKPFDHPQLGPVEIGGWDRMNFWRNPPPALREAEVARFPAWMTQIALSLPRLELLSAEVESLGADSWRVRLAVGNCGLAAGLCQQARAAAQGGAWRDVRDRLGPDCAGRAGAGAAAHRGAAARRPWRKPSLQAFLPNREVTSDRALAEWVIRAPAGTALTLTARAARAGAISARVVLQPAPPSGR